MSISITTVNFADFLGPRPWEGPPAPFDETLDVMLGSLFGGVTPRFMVATGPSHFIPQVPTPISTSDFPDHPPPRGATVRTRNGRGKRSRGDCCPVCLELAGTAANLITMPCAHTMHRLCVFALLTAPVLGARSMLRCPMCRYTLDKYDVAAMGCDVSPRRLSLASRRCNSLRQLTLGSDHGSLAKLVRECSTTEAVDGFIYNAVVLSLERAIFHRLAFVRSLESQLRAPRNAAFGVAEFVESSLACHIEVLIRTTNVGLTEPA